MCTTTSIFLGYHVVSRVNPYWPHLYPKTAFWEHLQHKPMESVLAYILTTNKAVITKLDRSIKQVKYYIMEGQKGHGLGHVTCI